MYENLIEAIKSVIKSNGREEITGQILQDVLIGIVDALGSGYLLMGVATPETSPGTPDGNVAYLAATNGSYANFGGLTVCDEIALLIWDGSWHKQTLAKKPAKIIDSSNSIQFSESNKAVLGADGDLGENPFMDATDYFEIPENMNVISISVPVVLSLPLITGCAFYDANKNFIPNPFIPTGVSTTRGAIIKRFIIPTSAKYIRTTFWNESSRQQFPELTQDFSCVFSKECVGDISELFKFDTLSVIDGTNGNLSYNSIAFAGSDYVDIRGFKFINILRCIGLINATGGYAFYDSEKNFISGGIYETADTRQARFSTVEIPANATYIRVTYWHKSAQDAYSLPAFSAFGSYDIPETITDLMDSEQANEKTRKNFDADFNGIHPMPLFTTFGDCGIYQAEVQTEAPTINDMASAMIAKYDALVSANPDRMTKTDLGIASDGVSHIYAYNIKPLLPKIDFRSNQGLSGVYYPFVWRKYPQPTIVVTSGVHGNEKGAVSALYNLISQMLGQDATKETNYILNNCNLCIVPIVNPYGYDHKQRFNYNNVDINNDYGTFAQAESRIIRDYVDSLDNVVGFLDCHNCATRPSIWAEAGNEIAKNFVMSSYPYLLNIWKETQAGIVNYLPMSYFYVNGWRGVASNYFFGKGIVAMTAETVCSYQNNIVDNNADFTQYDAFAVQMGMDMYANALIHILKSASIAARFAKGQEVFAILSSPQNATISSGQTATFNVIATGFVLSYRWEYSVNGGSSWLALNQNGNQVASPMVTLAYENVRNGELLRCKVEDSYGKWAYTEIATIIKN